MMILTTNKHIKNRSHVKLSLLHIYPAHVHRYRYRYTGWLKNNTLFIRTNFIKYQLIFTILSLLES